MHKLKLEVPFLDFLRAFPFHCLPLTFTDAVAQESGRGWGQRGSRPCTEIWFVQVCAGRSWNMAVEGHSIRVKREPETPHILSCAVLHRLAIPTLIAFH